jgi:hypothetical protein
VIKLKNGGNMIDNEIKYKLESLQSNVDQIKNNVRVIESKQMDSKFNFNLLCRIRNVKQKKIQLKHHKFI